jgi:hypothetical protein
MNGSVDGANASNEIAAVRARLPYFDRRALSQAWFSAFHLASDGAPPRFRPALPFAEMEPFHAPRGALARADGAPHALSNAATNRGPRGTARAGGLAATSPRSIAREARPASASASAAQAARSYPPVHATFTLAIEGARVAILLRRDGPALHVVALCTRRHVELVSRALACAGIVLRAQGERVHASLRSVEPAR